MFRLPKLPEPHSKSLDAQGREYKAFTARQMTDFARRAVQKRDVYMSKFENIMSASGFEVHREGPPTKCQLCQGEHGKLKKKRNVYKGITLCDHCYGRAVNLLGEKHDVE